jgi:hypothetical protein
VLAALNLAFDQGDSTAKAPAAAKDTPQVSAADQERLTQLLKRLDQVLKQDGQYFREGKFSSVSSIYASSE